MSALIPFPRSAPQPPPSGSAPRGPSRDRDLWAVGVVLWLGSVARVAIALVHHEVFGTEATLALGCVVLVPWLVWRSWQNEARSEVVR